MKNNSAINWDEKDLRLVRRALVEKLMRMEAGFERGDLVTLVDIQEVTCMLQMINAFLLA
jgi:hypothetical protein